MDFHIERNYTFTNETKMNMSDKNKRTSDNKEISHSLGNDFKIFRNSTKFSIPLYPSYSRRAVVAFCTEGRAKVDVHGYEHSFTKGELVVIFPGQLVSLSEISQDFTVSYFSLSLNLYNDVLSGIRRFSPHFFFYMRSHYHYKLSDLETSKYINFFQLIYSKVNAPENLYRKDSIVLLMRIFYLDLYNIYKVNSHTGKQTFDNHKKELTHGFFLLIMKFYKENRSVAFYADKLHITPKYLTMVVKEVSGMSAKDWITEYILQEIKFLLKNSSLNVQEIAIRTHFSNQTSLGRFFRQHTGLSPSDYRKQNQ